MTNLPIVKCPHCGGEVDGVEDASLDDWYVCLGCERLSQVIDTDGTKSLRKVSRSELADANPLLQRAVIQTAATVQRMKRGPFQ